MSYTAGLPTIAERAFQLEFEQQMQQKKRKLAGVFDEKYGLTGDSLRIKFAKQIIMQKRTAKFTTQVQQIPEYREVILLNEDYATNLPCDLFEGALIKANEVTEQTQNAVKALNRMQDQIILDAFVASTPTDTVAQTSNLTVAGLNKARKILHANNSGDEPLILIAHVSQRESLLNQEKATSIDYNSVKALTTGVMNESYLGFSRMIFFGDINEGGLPISTSIRKCYAVTASSLTMGYWLNPEIKVIYDDKDFCWRVLPHFKAGAKVKDEDGVVLINCTEA